MLLNLAIFVCEIYRIMSEMEFLQLNSLRQELLIDGFIEAFADYAVDFSREQIKFMLQRRGFDPSSSCGAVADGRLVSFIFNGIGSYDAIPTAYDTGTGTIPDFRGSGIVQRLFNYIEPVLYDNNIRQYLLEVLCDNAPAIAVYRKLGFQIRRQFTCHVSGVDYIKCKQPHVVPDIEVRDIARSYVADICTFCDFEPSWQNSCDSIMRAEEEMLVLGAFDDDKIIGYAVLSPSQGDLTQLAVAPEYRRNGVGSILFKTAMERNQAKILKVINVDSDCSSLIEFLEHRNMAISSRQYEMNKILR